MVSNAAGSEMSSEALLELEALLLALQQPSVSNRIVNIKMSIPSNRAVWIQGSSDLISWTNLTSVQSSSGTFQFIDSESPKFNKRFYRLQLTP
jgi:hypothetical protein